MKLLWFSVSFLLIGAVASGQLIPAASPSAADYLNDTNRATSYLAWKSDPQTFSRYSSPGLTQWPGAAGGQAYWLGTTTTQSFNRGKFGTIYYYDVMGNMRYARTFIDIAGKNKRGLKLLLPTFNQRMFGQH